MSTYLKKFNDHTEYSTFTETEDFILPNVSFCKNQNEVHYNPTLSWKIKTMFSVTDISEPTIIGGYVVPCGSGRVVGFENVEKLFIDGVEVEIPQATEWKGYEYQFETTGIHRVDYLMKNTRTEEIYDEQTDTVSYETVQLDGIAIDIPLFYRCRDMIYLNIPNSVNSINIMFEENNLKTIKVADSNKTYDSRNDCNAIIGPLTESVYNEQTGEWEEVTTENCLILGCDNTVIPNDIAKIGSSAFAHCKSLTNVTIPNGVTSIGNNAFRDCFKLTSVTIPDSVTSIGASAFSHCYELANVNIPSGITVIENSVFGQCKSLKSIVIPNGVTSIGNNAFRDCFKLTSVTIPDSVTSIGASAFSHCYELANVNIPSGITVIENSVFGQCKSLKSIVIPSGVTSIGNSAFHSCDITNIVIPSNVTSIGEYCFWYCFDLTNITCLPINPPVLAYNNVFDNSVAGRKIYVPAESVNAYKTANRWKTYATEIYAIE